MDKSQGAVNYRAQAEIRLLANSELAKRARLLVNFSNSDIYQKWLATARVDAIVAWAEFLQSEKGASDGNKVRP
jgi:hypothetical protein